MAGIRIRYPLVNQYSTGVLSQAQGPLERQQILGCLRTLRHMKRRR